MGRIEREWLRRIPGYRPAPAVRRKGFRPDEGGKGRLAPDRDGDPTVAEEGEDAQGAEAEAEEGAAARPGHRDPDREGRKDSPDAGGEPGGPAGDEVPPLDTELAVPDEIEQARRAAEARKERTPWNRFHAPRAFPLEGRYLRGLATRFARMVAKLAEDNAELPQEGDDEWDLNALVRRRFTGRLPHQCRIGREKRRVVVVLDTSPSCAHQARLFGSIAQIAEALGDCEMFDAPNFSLVARWRRGQWEELPPDQRGWAFRHRVVLAFGDFDGIEHICEASSIRGNRIYWFSCEERPQVLERSRDYFVKHYKGHYHPANDLNALMRAMGRVR